MTSVAKLYSVQRVNHGRGSCTGPQLDNTAGGTQTAARTHKENTEPPRNGSGAGACEREECGSQRRGWSTIEQLSQEARAGSTTARPTRALSKSARPCAGVRDTHARVYITMTDYENLGKTAGLESGLKTLWDGTEHRSLVRPSPHWGYAVTCY